MDVYRFINSKDIRKHLKEIGYEFTSLEAAWLVYQCRTATIAEKHKAWEKLIETMPDCTIEGRRLVVFQESLHTFLKKYMELENKLVDAFYDERPTSGHDKPSIYKFEYTCKNGSKYDWDTVFSHFDAIFEIPAEQDEDVVSIQCTKMQLNGIDSRQIAVFSPSFEMLRLDPGSLANDADEKLYRRIFEGLWFDFPTPFHKGDIIWDPCRPKGFCAGPFVVTGICLEGVESEQLEKHIRNGGDNSDMGAAGYFLWEDGSVYAEGTWNYMDLEFYENKLTGRQRTLIALSNFLKDKIDLSLFAQAYHQIIMTGYSTDSMPWNTNESGLILAGLEKAKEQLAD